MFGFIAHEAKGKVEVQKIAYIRLDFIEGNVNSYSELLNDPKRLKRIEDFNQLRASVAEGVRGSQNNGRFRERKSKETEAAEKARG